MNDYELPEGMDEGELLKVLTAQREAAIGFDQDRELNEDRARALDYYRGRHEGYVKKDLPVESDQRSQVVSTDVADFVETALPDLMEIFGSSDDAITFPAVGPEDEEAAQQETDYVRHVFFEENNGWMLLYDAFKNALIAKTGVWKYYWDGTPEYENYETETDEIGLGELQAMGVEIVSAEPDEYGVIRVECRKLCKDGRLVVECVSPEDFAVSRDTIHLAKSDYTAHRTRVTIQSLRKRGYDEDLIQALQEEHTDEDVDFARDTAYEHEDEEDSGTNDLKLVEVIEHYIRLDADSDGDPQLYRIVTGNDERVILEIEKRAQVEFAAICPFPMPGRFYGQSGADKLIPVQKWKTHITRLANDSFAYSLHQRPEIALNEIVDKMTIPQLQDNAPGKPFVTKTGNGVTMHGNSADPGAALSYLEYINTVAESRTGFVRNAQGLNPDTLHDTKGGAEMLVGAAQKRVRMMARLFAETGLRDLFLGIHELLRSNATMQETVRLRGQWVQVDPANFRKRSDMRVDIGVGSGGRDQDLAGIREFANIFGQQITMQGGQNGPIVNQQGVFAFMDHYAKLLGLRAADKFLIDPSTQPKQPQADPAAMAAQQQAAQAQAEMQMKAGEAQQKLQIEREKIAAKAQADQMKMMTEAQLKIRQQDIEAELKRRAGEANIQAVRFGGQTG